MTAAVTVKFFASLREDLGHAELELAAGSVADLLEVLRAELGAGMSAIEQENVRIAVNQDLVDDLNQPLRAGDEVAFLPPVTGG